MITPRLSFDLVSFSVFEFERAGMGDNSRFFSNSSLVGPSNGARIFVEGYVNGQLVFGSFTFGIGEARLK